MRLNDKKNLELILNGLISRYNNNAVYFTGASASFKSGLRNYSARLIPNDKELILLSQGRKQKISISEFMSFFVSEFVKYESSALEFSERSITIIVETDKRGVRSRQVKSVPKNDFSNESSVLPDREYVIKINEAPELLREIGVLSKDGRILNDMIRKYNQIDHFVELARPVLEKLTDETIYVLDCACGKSYLSFAMNYLLHDIMKRRCFITGVDISNDVIKASNSCAQRLGYRNMNFIHADLREYQPDKPTVVISLHACDTATDMALGIAVRSGAKCILCVPCCHKELLGKYNMQDLPSVVRSGILAARFNDVMTDTLRVLKLQSMGYDTSIVEYISPLDTPKNLLIRAVKTSDRNERAENEYNKLLSQLAVVPAIERECSLFTHIK